MAELSFIINGKQVSPPIQWQDIKLLAAWINENGLDNVKPAITGEAFNWERDAAQEIQRHIATGITGGAGIFSKPTLSITASDTSGTDTVFNGHIDLNKNFRVLRENRVECGVSRPEDLEVINSRLKAISYGYLLDKGVIKKSDYTKIDYIVINDFDKQNLVIWPIMIFILSKELFVAIEKVQEAFANNVKILTLTPFISVSPAMAAVVASEIRMALFKKIVSIIYLTAIIFAIKKLLKEIISYIIPKPRKYYGMTLRSLLTKALGHIGLTLDSNISELDRVVYLPSRTNLHESSIIDDNSILWKDRNQGGIPKLQDQGYSCAEMFSLCLEMFNAFVKVENGVCHLYPEGDAFWVKAGQYKLPDVLLEQPYEKKYNIDEAFNTKIFSFRTDTTDNWTVKNFTGTNIEVITESTIDIPLNQKTLTGLYEKRWPVALAHRRSLLGEWETLILNYAKDIDKAFKTLSGKATKYAEQITSLLSAMVVSTKHWSVPKVVYLNTSGGIPINHREMLSARKLYTKYWSYRTFAEPYTGQKIMYEGIKIPFGLTEWLTLTSNAYFITSDGRTGKFTSLEWVMGQNVAIASFWIQEVYVKTVKETLIEP